MDNERIFVRANIRLLPAAESGRTTSIRGSYRPNHNFFAPGNRNMTVGFIDLPEGTQLHPGESIDLQGPNLSRPGMAHSGRCQARRHRNHPRGPSRHLVSDIWTGTKQPIRHVRFMSALEEWSCDRLGLSSSESGEAATLAMTRSPTRQTTASAYMSPAARADR